MIKDFFAELFNSLLSFLIRIILLPYCIVITIIKVFMTCICLFPIRFSLFLKLKDNDRKYLALKTISIIVLFIPFLAITIAEFAVMLCELLITKIISSVLAIIPLLALVPNLIFGIITFTLVKFFEVIQYAIILSDKAYIRYSDYASVNPITENFTSI